MAGEWIKMRTDLLTHPKVVRIVSALKADRLRVIGGLHAVWCLFDTHSIDGTLEGYTPEILDEHLGWPGFSAEMIRVKWLEHDGESLSTPRFDEHNGQSAKRRATETQRKREARKDAEMSAPDADKLRSREEKRREDINPSPAKKIVFAEGFDIFWASYPKRVGKADAEKAWGKIKPDTVLQDKILNAVAAAAITPDWLKESGQFIPHASTWLNGRRWEDAAALNGHKPWEV